MTADARDMRSICIAGDNIVGLSAALAFARALPGVRVSILPMPVDPAAIAERLPATLPTIHRFHAAIGLDELDLVRNGIATHLLATRFDSWSATGESWYRIFGDHGLPAGEAAFHSLWQRARNSARALPFHQYAAAAALAATGKFVHPADDPQSPLSTFLYGLRLDPAAYRARLGAAAAAIPRETGTLIDIERRADGGIAALRLDGGKRVVADLFVDCSGPGARLRGAVDPAFESWEEWLPCDRLILNDEAPRTPNPCDRVIATRDGWRAELPDDIAICTAFSRRFAEGPEGEGVDLHFGRRGNPWIANVLAIGDAAVVADPLVSANLALAQNAILRAIALLPGRDCHPLELREYNRRTDQETLRVRDFAALHYLRSGRTDGPLWAAMAQVEPPDTLARTLEQFERRGRLPFFEEEIFDRNSWLAVLLGLGVIPKAVDAIAAGVDMDQASRAMQSYADRLARLPDRFPAYPDMLAKMRAAPAMRRR